VSAVWTELATR